MENDAALESQLRAHRAELQSKRENLLQRIEQLIGEQAEIERRIAAADVLLSQFTPAPTAQQALPIPEAEPAKPAPRDRLSEMTLAEACATVLARERRPMTVPELASALRNGGIRIASRTPQRSIASTLYRSRRFVKVARGTFALVSRNASSKQRVPRAGRLNVEGATKGTERVLREKGGPMHVRDILAALVASGFRSYARRPQAMLSGTLKRSPKFRLLGGDVWDLVDGPGSDNAG